MVTPNDIRVYAQDMFTNIQSKYKLPPGKLALPHSVRP